MFLSFKSHEVRATVVTALVVAASPIAPSNSTAQSAVQCTPAGPLVRVPDLPEGSGLAASRRSPGRFWSHNDSGDPVLVALDANGRAIGRLRIEGRASTIGNRRTPHSRC